MLPKQYVQAELEFTGICNLNCNYCYIPKDIPVQAENNKQIIEQISTGKYVQYLKELFAPDQLIALSLWGTEPTINMPVAIKSGMFEELLKYFNNLNEFSFSTNMINNFNKIRAYIEYMAQLSVKYNRHLKLSIQLSNDGDQQIDDKNRGEGSQQQIVNTINQLKKYYNSDFIQMVDSLHPQISISHSYKPTLDIIDVRRLTDPAELDKYCKFFNDLNEGIYENDTLRNYVHWSTYSQPTVQGFGEYSAEDGKQFQKFVEVIIKNGKQLNQKYPNQYIEYPWRYRLLDLIKHEEINNSCSQGRSMIGLSPDGSISPCHTLFFMYNPEYKQMFLNQRNYQLTNQQFIQQIENNIIDQKDQDKLNRFIYRWQAFHSSGRSRIQYAKQMQFNLKRAGLLSDPMLDDQKYFHLFGEYMQNVVSCPMQFLLDNGSTMIVHPSFFKLFGNGQFNLMIREIAGEFYE